MNVSQERAGNYLIVDVNEQRVDSTNFLHLEYSLGELIKQGEKNLIINLSQVGFMDSCGISCMLPCVRSLANDGNLFLVGLNSTVSKLFSLSKTDSIFKIYQSVEEALQQ